jgi:hypothetical protein
MCVRAPLWRRSARPEGDAVGTRPYDLEHMFVMTTNRPQWLFALT